MAKGNRGGKRGKRITSISTQFKNKEAIDYVLKKFVNGQQNIKQVKEYYQKGIIPKGVNANKFKKQAKQLYDFSVGYIDYLKNKGGD